MPTGYTADVADGKITDLSAFALLCARGMGALITMRDEPWDAPIPEQFEPSDYHAKKLDELRQRRQDIYNLTNAEADAVAKAEYEDGLASKARWAADKADRRQRYEAMIALVEPWERAPDGLKEFMLEQLHSGMDFDCPLDQTYWNEPVLLSGSDWRRARLSEIERDFLYHSKEDGKERARTDGRNAWIAQLRTALRAQQGGSLRDGGCDG
jgi:hypothetical protein